MKPYIKALTDTDMIRETALTEDDLTPKPQLFYPQAQRKLKVMMKESKANDRTSLQDQVCGVLNPIVYALNKGKNILPNSLEHRILKDLLKQANQ
jgi:hypothetical protein